MANETASTCAFPRPISYYRVLVFRGTFQVPRSLATSHTGSSGDDMDHDAGEDTDIIEEQPMEVSGTTVRCSDFDSNVDE